MLDLIRFRSGAKRGRLISKGLVLLLVLSSCAFASQAEAAEKGSSGGWTSESAKVDCEQGRIELDDGTEVVLPAADPASCPAPKPVDCDTFLGSEAKTPAEVSNLHQVKDVCTEYPRTKILTCPGDKELHPQLTLPNATVVHGDHEQIDILLDVLFSDHDLQGWLNQYFDPSDPDFYSADPGLGYLVVPLDAETLQQIIDQIGLDLVRTSPVHVYHGHKMSRGHPVDEFDDLGAVGNPLPPIHSGSNPVVVVDAGGTPGDGGVLGHGAFASEVVRAEGAASDQIEFDVRVSKYFDDTDIVPAILDGFFNSDPNDPSIYPPATVVNLSFGAYNCGLATAWLTEALDRLADNGHHLVASAGNSETNELVFPAALAIDWREYGSEGVFIEGGGKVRSSLHKQINSVGSTNGSNNRSCFSNHGVWVENWFPGEEVYAEDSGSQLWGGTWSGTSFAAPQAAAAIANGKLTKQKAPHALTARHEYPTSSGDSVWSYCAPGTGYEPTGL